MASVEFIQKRIDGKKAELDKLEKKMARVLKAKESNYEENNPYYYSDYDFRSTTREIELAKQALADWENKLVEENNKAASRNVPAITEFLDMWEQRVIEFYTDSYERYKDAYQEYRADMDRMQEELRSMGRAQWDKDHPRYEEYQKLYKEKTDYYKRFHSTWRFIEDLLDKTAPFDEAMRHMVAEEKKRKYDFLIERVCSIVGTITDASNLRVGAKGDLNGYIVGTDGKCSVQTIGAGGWNIQVFHYRTLIKRIK